MQKIVLVTGGAGYIGSHACVELVKAGYEVVILDNFCNSNRAVLERIAMITNKGKPKCIEGDVRDRALLDQIFADYDISAVMNFAGLKAVGESVAKPLYYFDNNVNGVITLLEAMKEADVKTFVFSSSATVYGDAKEMPIKEDSPLMAVNPYGRTKLMAEEILGDLVRVEADWRIACLRYFNPVGAHDSGLIGEDPQGVPNNLMPYIAQVASGKLECLSVYGGDYPTRDGTGVRDYIHVVDLVKGHVDALAYLEKNQGLLTVNLGTGTGYSVLEMVKAFEAGSGQAVAYEITERRAGDVAECYADPSKASELLNWKAEKSLEDMCADTWKWQSTNPNGFDG